RRAKGDPAEYNKRIDASLIGLIARRRLYCRGLLAERCARTFAPLDAVDKQPLQASTVPSVTATASPSMHHVRPLAGGLVRACRPGAALSTKGRDKAVDEAVDIGGRDVDMRGVDRRLFDTGLCLGVMLVPQADSEPDNCRGCLQATA